MTEATTIIKEIHFDWENPELTLTSPSQGGAASLKNDQYLTKADKASEEDLDETQRKILEDIGEEFVPLQKDNSKDPSSSASGASLGEETNLEKENDDTMSDITKMQEKLDQMEKALNVQKAINELSKYSFEKDVLEGVADAVASLEDVQKEAVVKALDALVAEKEEAVEKAERAEVDADKAKDEENGLQKALSEEAGNSQESEEEAVEKTLAERAREEQDKMNGKGE